VPLFQSSERRFAGTLSRLIYSNPFLPQRVELERELLGDDYEPAPWVYYKVDELDHEHPNLTHLDERVERLAARARLRLVEGVQLNEAEVLLYADVVTYLLYRRFRSDLLEAVARGLKRPNEAPVVPFWKRFAADFKHFLALPGLKFPAPHDSAYLLACLFQVRRAFYQIYHHIAGASRPAASLRGTVWQSIFTHNMERHFRLGLYQHMGRFPFHSLRHGARPLRCRLRKFLPCAECFRLGAQSGGIGAVWSYQGRIHWCRQRPTGLARKKPRIGKRVP